jgi:hypothetical protein
MYLFFVTKTILFSDAMSSGGSNRGLTAHAGKNSHQESNNDDLLSDDDSETSATESKRPRLQEDRGTKHDNWMGEDDDGNPKEEGDEPNEKQEIDTSNSNRVRSEKMVQIVEENKKMQYVTSHVYPLIVEF